MPFGQSMGRNAMMGAGQAMGNKMGGGMKPQPMPMQRPQRPMQGPMGQGAPMGQPPPPQMAAGFGRAQGAGGLAPSANALGGIMGGFGMKPPMQPPMNSMPEGGGPPMQAQGPPMGQQGGGFGGGQLDPQILANLMQARQQQQMAPPQPQGIGPSMMRRPMMRR